MRSLRSLAWIGVLVAAPVAAPEAGSLHPRLEEELGKIGPDAFSSVIISLPDQQSLPAPEGGPEGRRAGRRERHARVIRQLMRTAEETQGPLREDLDHGVRAGTVRGYTCYWIANLIVVDATGREIRKIGRRSDVDSIEPNFAVEPIMPGEIMIPDANPCAIGTGTGSIPGVAQGVRAIKAPQAWREFGLNGAGRLVAILDTGVEGSHPALANRWRGRDAGAEWWECWLDLAGTNSRVPVDREGHGTAVMGTLAGLAPATGDTIGVAWGAKWIACNATGLNLGGGFDNAILSALQWFAEPDGDPETIQDVPDVVQNSWGVSEQLPGRYRDCDRRWWNAIDNCEAAGVVTIWSAGNAGPNPGTIRSPADRGATVTNAFSVGAVDAAHYEWPYPVARFSSRGPTMCDAAPAGKIKPEVVAPGVEIYTADLGGGFSATHGGSSAAGPHVAGIVALIRQANPDLDADAIKQIIMMTARDEGEPGEDNAYGWGFVDARAAVEMALEGLGGIEGLILNGSSGEMPVRGVEVRLIENDAVFSTGPDGRFRAWAPAGAYHLEVRHPGFRTDTLQVDLAGGRLLSREFRLVDDKGPEILDVTRDLTSADSIGSYPFRAIVRDPSRVGSVNLRYRLNGARWRESVMAPDSSGGYEASIPRQPAGTRIDYYVEAVDGVAPPNGGSEPAGAPISFHTLYRTRPVLLDDAEADRGWAISAFGDNATGGRWVRSDPYATSLHGKLFQMEDDHTPDPGARCFVTGNGPPGSHVSDHDVDRGCTTLTSPTFDLSHLRNAFVSYYRWYAQAVWHQDELQVDLSSDGGGTWVPLERVAGDARGWRRVAFDLGALVTLTDRMVVRFRACDLYMNALIEAGIDDFAIETFPERPAGPWDTGEESAPVRLSQNEPNPAAPVTMIRFWVTNPGPARLEVFDVAGRSLRTLVDETVTAGRHDVPWDCTDDSGRLLPSGVYLYRLKAGAFEQSRRLAIMR